MDYIDIVFDRMPGAESAEFVEVENSKGESVRFGEWVRRPDGYAVLRIPVQGDGVAVANDHPDRHGF